MRGSVASAPLNRSARTRTQFYRRLYGQRAFLPPRCPRQRARDNAVGDAIERSRRRRAYFVVARARVHARKKKFSRAACVRARKSGHCGGHRRLSPHLLAATTAVVLLSSAARRARARVNNADRFRRGRRQQRDVRCNVGKRAGCKQRRPRRRQRRRQRRRWRRPRHSH